MPITRFILPFNATSVGYYLASIVRFLSVIFAVPLLFALVAREWSYAGIFAGLAAASFGVGTAARRTAVPELELREALVVTALSYLLFALWGSLAFLPFTSPINGFFEAMSGVTSTGLSVLDVSGLPRSLLFFRAWSQWVGGAGIVILSLVILNGPGSAAFKLYASEFGEDNVLGSVRAMGRVVMFVYSALTLAAFATFVLAGMGFFDGLLHALATLSTGGFSVYAESIGVYGPLTEAVIIPFMVLGALSFPLLYLTVRNGPRALLTDVQLRTFALLVLVSSPLLLAFYGWREEAFLPVLFNLVSGLTTTGFSTTSAADWPSGVKFWFVALMIVGGSTGSSAGGLKLLRFVIVSKLAGWSVVRALLPEAAKLPLKVAGTHVTDGEVRRLGGLFGLYLGLGFVTAVVLMLAGGSSQNAAFDAFSALGTVGLSTGVVSNTLPFWAKLPVCLLMWAGRLEILPVLVLLYPHWRKGDS